MQNYFCPSHFNKTNFGSPDKATDHTDHNYLLDNSEYSDDYSEDSSDRIRYSNLELGFNSENYCPNYGIKRDSDQVFDYINQEEQSGVDENFLEHETLPTSQDLPNEEPNENESSTQKKIPQENFPKILHKKILKQTKSFNSHFPKKQKAADTTAAHNKYSKPAFGDQNVKDYISFCPGNNFFLPGEPPKRSYIKKNAYPTYSELSKLMNYLLDLDWSDSKIFKPKLFTPNVFWFILCFLYFPRNAFARKNIREFIHHRFQKLSDPQFNVIQRIQKEQFPDFSPPIIVQDEIVQQFMKAAKAYNDSIRTNDYLQKICCPKAMKVVPRPNYTSQDDEWLIQIRRFIFENYTKLQENGYLGVENNNNVYENVDSILNIDLQEVIGFYERNLYQLKAKTDKRLVVLENQVYKILENETHLFKNDFEANDCIVDLAMKFPEEENYLKLLEEIQNLEEEEEIESVGVEAVQTQKTKTTNNDHHLSYHSEKICDICNEGDTEGESIITCIGCNIQVHLFCYGLNNVVSDEWSCDVCSQFGQNGKLLRCPCCPIRGGAMKKSALKANTTIFKDTNPSFQNFLSSCIGEKNQAVLSPKNEELYDENEPRPQEIWVHVTCALFIPSLYFKDSKNVNQITGLENINKKDFLQKCEVCGLNKVGVALNCIRPGCKRRFHVECGRRAGYYLDFIEDEHSKGEYNLYCSKHTPLKLQKKLDGKENAMRIEIERFFQAVQKTIGESIKQTERTLETVNELQKTEDYETGSKIRKQKDDANYFMKLVNKYKERFPHNPISISVETSGEGFSVTQINIPSDTPSKETEKLYPDDYIWYAMPYKNWTAAEKYKKYHSIISKKEKKAQRSARKRSNKKRKASNDQANILYCLCKKPYSGEEMIACENCDNWYHPKCVGISRTANLEKLKWVCSNCIYAKRPVSQNTKRRNNYDNVENEVLPSTRRKKIKG